jgi:8-oxo-dGTP diphosphatase
MAKNKGPILTVDALIEDDKGRVLLIKRGVEPFKGRWCLPGGKVDEGERVEAALEREMMEELKVRIGIRELLGIYSEPDRDPRGHYVSALYHATIVGGEPTQTDEVSGIKWVAKQDTDLKLGFDHGKMLQNWWSRNSKGKVWPRPKDSADDTTTLRTHPVDDDTKKNDKNEIAEDDRLVEDEAARGKRVVKGANGKSRRKADTMAVPMKGSGAKKTAAAGKAGTRRHTR